MSVSAGAAEAVKAAPPIAITAATLAGLSLQEWVYVMTILYTLMLIGQKLAQFWRWLQRGKNATP